MQSPKEIRISDYHYDLPDSRIARFPLEERDASKLLVWENGNISEDIYRNLPSHLQPGTSLVFNNTRVVEARILFTKPTGGQIEVFALEPGHQYPDITSAMLQTGSVQWKCLVGGASKWKKGMVLEKQLGATTLKASIADQLPDCFLLNLEWNAADMTFAELLHRAGLIPLPPYLKRDAEASDNDRYQTIYAKEEGSVAAPTAGLHFTDRIFESLREKQITSRFVTLHVGAGTFKPVKSETMEDHLMHAEFIDVSTDNILALSKDEQIVAVGTTSLRTLESLYWMGIKASLHPNISLEEMEIKQWDVYDQLQYNMLPREEALQHLLTYMHLRKMERMVCRTRLLIAPGYQPQMISGIITNFHQPQSTLLLLIAALAGPRWREIYDYALTHDFRFLSYGDGSLIKIQNNRIVKPY
ncbi:MAG: S-adenosylmethionine:tRNA ribosyltransferase-isomerase [Sphingobacteriales bacterium]|nr:MAG: S-adenosylmethionine:tRNA ribosyltransferase-isomerase [Sphingobacteriales bacterium]